MRGGKKIVNFKKLSGLLAVTMLLAGFMAGCGGTSTKPAAAPAGNKLVVLSREDGSGTRGAFIELFGVEQANEAGKKIDKTIDSASITNSTAVMLTTVAGNKDAIGYISLGSLNDTVKALSIDSAAASVANIKNKTYKISRPFNVATKGQLKPQAQAFLNYILSREGQDVITKNGYIGSDNAPAYQPAPGVSGKVVVAGSSSVTPVMEKLKEAYAKVNPNVQVEVQQSDSTTGMKSTISGVCDIGMASREAKKSELDAGLQVTAIATDGIAIIVNKANPLSGLTKEQVRDIYTGKLTQFPAK